MSGGVGTGVAAGSLGTAECVGLARSASARVRGVGGPELRAAGPAGCRILSGRDPR